MVRQVVTATRFRPELHRWIRHVQHPEGFVVITTHGREVAALISVDNLNLLFDQWDEHRIGPINPATGRPFGRDWVVEHFHGHYRRERDPDAHLHPRPRDCPWLGNPFEWPPRSTPDAPATGSRLRPPREPEVAQPAPEVPAPRWWQVWRR